MNGTSWEEWSHKLEGGTERVNWILCKLDLNFKNRRRRWRRTRGRRGEEAEGGGGEDDPGVLEHHMEQSQFSVLTCPQFLHSSVKGKYTSLLLEALGLGVVVLRQLRLYPNDERCSKFYTLAIFPLAEGLVRHSVFCFILFYFILLFYRAALVAYGGSQGRGPIRATAASLHHSHARSEPCLQLTPQLMATPDP